MTDGNEWWTKWSLEYTRHSVMWMGTERSLNGVFQFSRNGGVSSCVKSSDLMSSVNCAIPGFFPFFRFFKLFHSFSSCWHSLNLRYYLFGIWHFCPFLDFPSSAPCRSFLMLYTILVNVFIFLTMFPCINIVDWGSWWHLDIHWHSFATASPG